MNKKAQAFRNKNHIGAQTQVNTDTLQQLGQIIMPLSLRVFEMEKTIENLQRQVSEAKTMASLAELKASAIQKLANVDAKAVKAEIVSLQKADFKAKSEADDKRRNLTTVEGAAELGQIALISGEILKDGVSLENEEVIGSKITLGDDDLYEGIDESVIGMVVGETKLIDFKVREETYQFLLTLNGLRTAPSTEGNPSEEAQTN